MPAYKQYIKHQIQTTTSYTKDHVNVVNEQNVHFLTASEFLHKYSQQMINAEANKEDRPNLQNIEMKAYD